MSVNDNLAGGRDQGLRHEDSIAFALNEIQSCPYGLFLEGGNGAIPFRTADYESIVDIGWKMRHVPVVSFATFGKSIRYSVGALPNKVAPKLAAKG